MSIAAGSSVQQLGVVKRPPRRVVRLPSISVGKAPNGLVKPRAIRTGELVHVRFEFRRPQAFEIGEDSYRGRKFYGVVPREKANDFEEVGAQESGDDVLTGFARHDLEAAAAPMASVRIDRGSDGKTSFLVPEGIALKWVTTTVRFQRLLEDYQAIMNGGIR